MNSESTHKVDDVSAGEQRRWGTFPAGVSVLALFVWFVCHRLITIPSRTRGVPSQRLIDLGVSASVLGSVLACCAIALLPWTEPRKRTPIAYAVMGLQTLLAAPLCLRILSSLSDEASPRLQLWSLCATVLFVLATGVVSVVRSRGLMLAQLAVAHLVVGQVIELTHWPMQLMIPAEWGAEKWRQNAYALGRISELLSLVGAGFGFAWALQSSVREVGRQRTMAFVPIAAVNTLVFSSMGIGMNPVHAKNAADWLFNLRSSLLVTPGQLPSRGTTLLYLLIPELLFGAMALSAPPVTTDGGAAWCRLIGWSAVLIGGFAKYSPDPSPALVHMVVVALGTALIARSAVLDAERARTLVPFDKQPKEAEI